MEPSKADPPTDHAFFDLAGNPSLFNRSPCLSRQQLNKLTTMTTIDKGRYEVMDSMECVIAICDSLKDAIYFVHKWNNEHEWEDTFLIYDDHEKKPVGVYW